MQETIANVNKLLGVNWVNSWQCAGGRVWEWQLDGVCILRMADDVKTSLDSLGCHYFDVDTSREPYYFVCVRLWISDNKQLDSIVADCAKIIHPNG